MKTKIEVFHLTDLMPTLLPDFKICWYQLGEDCVLCYKQISESVIRFTLVSCDSNLSIEIDPDNGIFITRPEEAIHFASKDFDFSQMTSDDYVLLPDILGECITLLRRGSRSLNRVKIKHPLVDIRVVDDWEQSFYEFYVEPYIQTHTTYAIAQSGMELCERLGVKAIPIYANHYDSDNVANDALLKDTPEFRLPKSKDIPVLIVDDLINTGKTAQFVIKLFNEEGFNKIRFVSLYNILANNQIPEILNYTESYKFLSNACWYFGRGMDLFSQSSRGGSFIWGADLRRPDFDKKGNINELRNFFGI